MNWFLQRTSFAVLLALIVSVPQHAHAQIALMAPLPGCSTIPQGVGLEMMFAYFNCAVGWLYNIGIGVCVLWTLIGGIYIIISGDNADLYGKGKNFMIGSITGLLMLIFAPTILKFLNSGGYN